MGMPQVVLALPLTGGQPRLPSLQRRGSGVLSGMPSQCPQLLPPFLRRFQTHCGLDTRKGLVAQAMP